MTKTEDTIRVLESTVHTLIHPELVALRFRSALSEGPLYSLSLHLAEKLQADLGKAIAHVRLSNEKLRQSPAS